MLNSMKMALVLATLFASGIASAATCTLTHSVEGKQCAGLFIKDSNGTALSQCSSADAAKDAFTSLMKAGMCGAFECSIKQLTECSDHGGYAITNQDGEAITPCETGRAAIDTLHSLTDAGLCAFKGW